MVILAVLAACDAQSSTPVVGHGVKEDARIVRAGLEMQRFASEIEQHHALRGAWPEAWSDLPRTAIDPWGTEYAFAIEDGRPVVWSAGPDGEFDTADDLVPD